MNLIFIRIHSDCNNNCDTILSSFLYIDIDECAGSPCLQGHCTDQVNGYICECILGYSGNRCDTGKLNNRIRNTFLTAYFFFEGLIIMVFVRLYRCH